MNFKEERNEENGKIVCMEIAEKIYLIFVWIFLG